MQCAPVPPIRAPSDSPGGTGEISLLEAAFFFSRHQRRRLAPPLKESVSSIRLQTFAFPSPIVFIFLHPLAEPQQCPHLSLKN